MRRLVVLWRLIEVILVEMQLHKEKYDSWKWLGHPFGNFSVKNAKELLLNMNRK